MGSGGSTPGERGPTGPQGTIGPTGASGQVTWGQFNDTQKDELLQRLQSVADGFKGATGAPGGPGPTGPRGPTGPSGTADVSAVSSTLQQNSIWCAANEEFCRIPKSRMRGLTGSDLQIETGVGKKIVLDSADVQVKGATILDSTLEVKGGIKGATKFDSDMITTSSNIIWDGPNKWIIHVPQPTVAGQTTGLNLMIAPRKADNSGWDWGKQMTIDQNGNVNIRGNLTVGGTINAGGTVQLNKLETTGIRIRNPSNNLYSFLTEWGQNQSSLIWVGKGQDGNPDWSRSTHTWN